MLWSRKPKINSARGTHATEGSICKPRHSERNARLTGGKIPMHKPKAIPSSAARPKPRPIRVNVARMLGHNTPSTASDFKLSATIPGEGNT